MPSPSQTQPIARTLSKRRQGSPMGSQKPLSPVQAAVMRQQDPRHPGFQSPSTLTDDWLKFLQPQEGTKDTFQSQLNDGELAERGNLPHSPQASGCMGAHVGPGEGHSRSGPQGRPSRLSGQPQRTPCVMSGCWAALPQAFRPGCPSCL